MSDIVRLPWLRTELRRLANECFVTLGSNFVLHIHANGRGASDAESLLSYTQIRSVIPGDLPVVFTSSPIEGKISAIYAGADLATECRAEVLIVVDNDVKFRSGSIDALVASYRATGGVAASAAKAPWVGARATAFERTYSHAVLESFRHDLFPKRPTGSFYAVDPFAVRETFNIGCADGDALVKIGARRSGVTVFSPYARTFQEEVSRRVRHHRASEARGNARLHSHPEFAHEALGVRLPVTVDRQAFAASVSLWRKVHEEAAAMAVRGMGIASPDEMGVIGKEFVFQRDQR